MIQQAQQGDRAAFGSLVKLYQKRAYAAAYGFVGNREDALELAQDAFVRAYRAMGRFDTTKPFYPWLYRIVRNTCLNHLKKRKRRGETSLNAMQEYGFDVASDDAGPEGAAKLQDSKNLLGEGLDSLSEDHREILVLRHLHELSYNEIADCLGIPRGTVMSRLHAARRILRDALSQTAETLVS